MSRFAQIIVFAAVLYPLTSSAQEKKPDFSGTWVMDVARSESPQPDGSPAAPITLVITQNNNEVRIEMLRDGKRQLAKYPLEHSAKESPTPIGTSGVGVGTIMRWEDGSLVTLTPYEVNGMAVTTVERRSLSDNGRAMTIVTTVEVQHGYQAGPNYSGPLKQVFTRVH